MMEPRHKTDNIEMERGNRAGKAAREGREPRYHVYVRLPFNRGGFVDPGTVNWDDKKSDALWSILSDATLADVNWNKLAAQFDVTVDFLLQMANYLTERHTTQLRAQMLKAAAARGSNAASPVPGAEPSGNQQSVADAVRRTSGGGRAPSALSVRTVTPIPKNDDEHPANSTLPGRPQTSRNPSSSNAAVPSQNHAGSRPGTATRLSEHQRRRLSYLPAQQQATQSQQQHQQEEPEAEEDAETNPPSPAATTSSSSSSSDSPVQSRIIRRPPLFQPKDKTRGGGSGRAFNDGPDYGDKDGDGDEDDTEPAFLPFKPQAQGNVPSAASAQRPDTASSSGQDLGATLRGDVRDFVGRRGPAAGAGAGAGDANQSQTSDSSAGSAAFVSRRPGTAHGSGAATAGRVPPAAPLSPRRTAELAGRRHQGSGAKGKVTSREGSDGAPSMGSSFSDLDDASVTQSALEEALASRMQDGTIGSRMSVIGQAIRSRYLPGANR